MENISIHSEDEEQVIKDREPMTMIQIFQRYLLVLVINLFFIFVFAYFISPLSKVNMISVVGNQDVYVQKIIDESRIKPGDSIYESRAKFGEIENKIVHTLPQISDAKITVDGINDISIEVDEFRTVAYIAEDESYLRVLENGTVLENLYATSIGNQLVLSKFAEGEALNLMIEELKKVEEPILNLISEIELVKTDQNPLFIEVYMNNGNRILSKIPDFSEKIPYYPQMVQAVEGEKGVFDMEAGIYFIPFVDGETKDSGVDEEAGREISEFDS